MFVRRFYSESFRLTDRFFRVRHCCDGVIYRRTQVDSVTRTIHAATVDEARIIVVFPYVKVSIPLCDIITVLV